jgi:DNA-nicking Smr family endonuclease
LTEKERQPVPQAPPVDEDDAALFRNSVRDVSPLPSSDKTSKSSKAQPSPVPRRIVRGGQTQPGDFSSGDSPLEIEPGDEWSFSRPGLPHQTMRRLRRGHWPIEAQLDLHGYTRDQALRELNAFLDDSHRRDFRCVRVIHGKGLSSRNQEPVLKARIGGWLSQRNDVLAFCQARPEDGGSGAVLVLLRSSGGEHSAGRG